MAKKLFKEDHNPAAAVISRTSVKTNYSQARIFRTIFILCKFDEANCTFFKFQNILMIFEQLAILFFKMRTKFFYRHIFIAINIPCKYGENICINE